MASQSLTDDASAFNQSSNSDQSKPFCPPADEEYLSSDDDELAHYLERAFAMITIARRSDFRDCAYSLIHHYFAVLDEQVFAALRSHADILKRKAKTR